MKTSILILATLLATIFTSCTAEDKPQYDTHIDSPNVDHVDVYKDTIFKETFGKNNGSTSLLLSDFKKAYSFDNPLSMYSSLRIPFDEMTVNPTCSVADPEVFVMREGVDNNIIYFKGVGTTNCWGGGGESGSFKGADQDLTISNINITTEKYSKIKLSFNYKESINGLKVSYEISSDGKKYTPIYVQMTDQSLGNVSTVEGTYSSQDLMPKISGSKYLRIKFINTDYYKFSIDNVMLLGSSN